MTQLHIRSRHLVDLWLIIVAAMLIWFVTLHPPLTAMAQRLTPLVFALAFILSYAGHGDLLSRWLLRNAHRGDRWLLAIALGIGLTGGVVFFLGLAGVLEPWIWALWTFAGVVLFGIGVWRDRGLPLPPPPSPSALSLLSVALLSITIVQILPYTLAPPSSTDALEYHLLIPKLYLQMGKIDLIPSVVESNYPCLAPFLYLPVMTLAGDVACKALHLWIGFALLVAIARLANRLGNTGEPYLAPALFLSMPVAALPLAVAWNDGFFVFFMISALNLLIDHHLGSRKNLRLLVAAGTLAGLAAWTKYTIVMFILALSGVFLLALWRWRWRLCHIVAFATPLGLLSLLVFGKNYAFTGNPFYPFLSGLFPNPAWTEAAAVHFEKALRIWEITDWSWHTYLSFPLHIVLLPRLIDIHPGLVPLLVAPFLCGRSRTSAMNFARLFIVCTCAAWLCIHTENRSLLTLFAVLIAAGCIELERVLKRWPDFRRPLLIILILISATNLGVLAVNTCYLTEPFAYFIGRENRSQYLAREAAGQQVFAWLDEAPAVNRVLLVGFRGPYHLNRIAYFSSFSDPPIAETISQGSRTADELATRLAELKITHIAIDHDRYLEDHRNRLYSWSAEERQVFEDFVAKRCRETARFGAQTIHQIR